MKQLTRANRKLEALIEVLGDYQGVDQDKALNLVFELRDILKKVKEK